VERLRPLRAARQERPRPRVAVHLKLVAVLLLPRVAVRPAVAPRLPLALVAADTDFWLPSGYDGRPVAGLAVGVSVRWQSKNESW
jgi:hypothetical protein